MRYVLDIETDPLPDITRLWCISMYNLDTKEMLTFREGNDDWKKLLDEATLVVGHNIINFDLTALKKISNYVLPSSVTVHDTMILSLILDYRRFEHEGHSLANWGYLLKYKKIDWRHRAFELGLIEINAKAGAEFEVFHEDMIEYCERDVLLTARVYSELLTEFKQTRNNSKLAHYIRAEHAAAKWYADSYSEGWLFDVEKANELLTELEEVSRKAHEAISAKLGYRCVAIDMVKGEVAIKEPKWTKNGYYHSHTANWFGVEPISGLDDPSLNTFKGHRSILGPYCRIEIRPLKLTSVADVKTFLFRNSWEPTKWNYKDGIQTSPVITEDSLEPLGGDGKLYTEFLSAKSRHSIIETWLKNTDDNNMLHGDCYSIGTPSMRTRHSIIVNVPSIDAPWGAEMRELFTTPKGWKQIGADSKGNQVRGLAHYLGDEEYIDVILNKDIHTYNANAITKALSNMGVDFEVPRTSAKRFLYAYLFGAGGGTLWSYIFGPFDKTKGNKLKVEFTKVVPGFKPLLDKLSAVYGNTSKFGHGYIESIAGNRIYVDSFHKLLVYLLQACEKITCSTALMLTVKWLEEAGIPYKPRIMMHDEIQFIVPEEYAEQAAALAAKSFKEGPKLYGIEIMDGDSKIGDNWKDCH